MLIKTELPVINNIEIKQKWQAKRKKIVIEQCVIQNNCHIHIISIKVKYTLVSVPGARDSLSGRRISSRIASSDC